MTPSHDTGSVSDTGTAWTFEDLALFLGAIIPAYIVSMLVMIMGRALAPGIFSSTAIQTLVFQGSIYGLLLLTLYVLISVRHDQPLWRSLGWTLAFRGAWVCVAAAPFLAIGISALGALLRAPAIPTPVQRLISDRVSLAIVALFATALGPVFEELLFRGFLFPVIQKALGDWPAIVLAAIPFALLHGSQYEWAWQHLLLIGMAGIVFGYARYRTGSTAASALLHAGYNVTLFVAYLFQRG